MSGIARGVDQVEEQNVQAAKRASGGFTPQLNLPIGGLARVRVLDGPVTYHCHRINDQAKKRTYYRYCTTYDEDVTDICEYCNNGVKVTRLFTFWVWVYVKLHTKPDDEGKWKQVKYKGKIYYQQDVNRPQILRRGMGKGNSMYDKFVSCYHEYGKWDDRDYIWARNTATNWQDTDYNLTPKDPTEEEPLLAKVAAQLPDLADVVQEKISQYPKFDDDGDIVEQAEQAETSEASTGGSKLPRKEREEKVSDMPPGMDEGPDDDDLPF